MRGVYILDLMVKISELEEISGQDIKNAANKQEHEPIDMICDILFNGKLSSSEYKVEEAAYKTYLENVLSTYEKAYNDTLDNDLKSSMIQLSYILRAKDFVDRDTIVDMLQKFIAEYSFKISNERIKYFVEYAKRTLMWIYVQDKRYYFDLRNLVEEVKATEVEYATYSHEHFD